MKSALRSTKPKKERTEVEKPKANADLLYVQGTTDYIEKAPRKHKKEITMFAHENVSNILTSAKSKINLGNQGV